MVGNRLKEQIVVSMQLQSSLNDPRRGIGSDLTVIEVH